jgi:endonuclease/exonuclease/phosphatase family metal-dependent hydrolase
MPKITDQPPIHIAAELAALHDVLDQQIPPKKLERTLLIATWNIRAFGDLTREWEAPDDASPKRDLHSLRCIAEIISRFDVIALQEVKGDLRALRDALKLLGRHWSLVLTDVTKGSAGNNERMAYLFDTRRVQMSGLACELVVPEKWAAEIGNNALQKDFARTPYAVSFRSENKTFILVTLHILYGSAANDRIQELRAIARWMSEWATDINAYDQNLIALGDFNIEKRGGILDQTFFSEGLFTPEAMQATTRSIFNKTKYYDHIAWFNGSNHVPKLSLEFLQGGNFDFVPHVLKNRELTLNELSWRISDHYPLWVEFSVE